MADNEKEIWKPHPEYTGVEVSTFGRVRILDRIVPCGRSGTRFVKGRILKQYNDHGGYLQVPIKVGKKWIMKRVNRLVAQTFIDNPDNLPMVNHRDCNIKNNHIENLEFCTASYNAKYREKYGVSRMEAAGKPVFAINLSTLKVLHFRSRQEAGRELGVGNSMITAVIKGRRNHTGGYLFKEDNGNGIEIDNDKLNDIVDGMRFRGGVFAVNLNTLEVSLFESQIEASRELGVDHQSINMVIKGKRNQTHGFWFVKDDGHAVEAVKSKLHDIGGTGLKIYS